MSFTRAKIACYLSELVGTFLLVFGVKMIVAGTASSPVVTPIGVGLLLALLVWQYGPLSGGHLNPAVTLGIVVRNPPSFPRSDFVVIIMYFLCQFVGGIFGGLFACAVGGEAACAVYTTVNLTSYTVGQAFLAEFAFTTMLVSMVLNVATDARIAGKQPYFGATIGLTLTLAAMAIGPITGAAINPAVFVGTVVSASISVTSLANMSASYIYILAHICAGVVAGTFFVIVYGGPEADGMKHAGDEQGAYRSTQEAEDPNDRQMEQI